MEATIQNGSSFLTGQPVPGLSYPSEAHFPLDRLLHGAMAHPTNAGKVSSIPHLWTLFLHQDGN